ncbi:MAG: hypothetical protein H0V17_23645 [Deltaproteobacteria bacterium]|nr:hypothetical protein [Deltaproteobacteria bacterium]
MTRLAVCAIAFLGCASPDPFAARTYEFGPFDVAAGEEVTKTCVQITLDNDDDLFINTIDLETGPGFHHSNWFFVPETVFRGDDGAFDCDDRGFNEAVAAVFGGVLFAQSTQSTREIQQFPDGVVIKVPQKSKLVSQVHLLNSSDAALQIRPRITVQPVPETAVATVLAAVSFQNQAIALPGNMQSDFTVECDLSERHQELFSRAPDFKLFYGLAHYHELGTKLTIEAITPEGVAAPVFTTENRVGDAMGGPLDPPFDMTGYAKLRFSCEYFNPRAETVRWGTGDQEMCVFLAFSDSTFNWGGGVISEIEPENPVQEGNTMHFTNSCTVLANDAQR